MKYEENPNGEKDAKRELEKYGSLPLAPISHLHPPSLPSLAQYLPHTIHHPDKAFGNTQKPRAHCSTYHVVFSHQTSEAHHEDGVHASGSS